MRRRELSSRFILVLFGLLGGADLAAQSVTPDPVRIDTLGPLAGPGLTEPHAVEVYLPPGYNQSGARRYPVLYCNDGQFLQHIDLPAMLSTEILSGQMAAVIMVAIHSTRDRGEEYGLAGQRAVEANGAAAAAYQQFILDVVMPMIAQRYRVLPGARHTGIMGFSMGALSAFDVLWNHPDRFGIGGLFSGSFWWRDNNGTPAERQDGRLTHRMVRQGKAPPGLRLWFLTGRQEEPDDRDSNGVIDMIQDVDELIGELEHRGYHRGGDVMWQQVDGDHSLVTWSRSLPEFLRWAYPTGSIGN